MSEVTPRSGEKPKLSKLLRGAIWIAIGALIAAALVSVVWVLVGDQDGLIGRAFLTILLLTLFAGIAVIESNLAPRRPDWLALASMATWIVALLVGAVKIWMPEPFGYFGWASERVFQLLVVIGILQLALVHPRLYVKAARRHVTSFTRVIVIVTYVTLIALVAMLVFSLTFPDTFVYDALYWRITVALAILAAVGTVLIPLLNALFAPRDRGPGVAEPSAQPMVNAWPTYYDGRTPLPAMPDGSPDWNAYYTGRPTYEQPPQAQSFPVVGAAVTGGIVEDRRPDAPPAPEQPPMPATPDPDLPPIPPLPGQPSGPPQPPAPPQPPYPPSADGFPAPPPAPEVPR